MKPIQITMEGFGSFGEKAVVDFTVPEQNLFLITGKTGAGKTTIFDAIVYALYGEVGSETSKKNDLGLQSEYRRGTTRPFVELTFSEKNGVQEEVYRVRRELRYVRPGKRAGAKDKTESERVVLTMPDGTVWPSKETNDKLVEIVGLNKNQFMQVVMIAQGEFRKLLEASSNERKEIFRKIFHTEIFEDILREFDRRRKQKQEEIRLLQAEIKNEVSQIQVPKEDTSSIDEAIYQIMTEKDFDITDLEKLFSKLKTLCEDLENRHTLAEENLKEAEKTRDLARDRHTRAESLMQAYAQKDKAEAELSACEQKDGEIREKKLLMARIRKAYEVRSEYMNVAEIEASVKKKEEDLLKKEEELPKISEQAENAAAEAEAVRKKAKKKEEAYARISERVANALETFAMIKEITKELKRDDKTLRQAKKTCDKAEKAMQALVEQEQDWREQDKKLSGADADLKIWEVQHAQLRKIGETIEAAKEKQQEVNQQEKIAGKAAKDYVEIQEKWKEKQSEYMQKREIFLDRQAGILAATLQEGSPCPVCGSLDHPHPCKLEEGGEELTRQIIDDLEKEARRLNHLVSVMAETAGKEGRELDKRKGALALLEETAREELERRGHEIPSQISLEEFFLSIREKDASKGVFLKEQAQILAQTREHLAHVDEDKERQKKECSLAEEAFQQADKTLEKTKTKLAEYRKRTEYSSQEAAKENLNEALREKETAGKRLSEAEEIAGRKASQKDRTLTLIKQLQRELPDERENYIKKRKHYQEVMEDSGLSEEDWQDLTKRYEKAEEERLHEEILQHQKKKSQAKGMLQAAEATIGKKEKPDMEKLLTEKESAQEIFDNARKEADLWKDYVKTDTAVLHKLDQQMQERAKKLEENSRIKNLYEGLAGKKSGRRMDIETYVQRYYLKKVLSDANRRFGRMSSGEFDMQMRSEEQAGEGATNHGLDLMAFSSITGKIREIRRLSGGEAFMAALSLALGMADQIQKKSSAVNLDIMFIDEGFGSLSAEERDNAVRILKEMAGESRLIGLISHVTELQQQIDDQLIVKKDEKGSSVKWR